MNKAASAPFVYLGFDFGTKNIGVAVGQMITKTASPLPIIPAKNGVPSWQKIKDLIDEWNPLALIVGVPIKEEDEDGAIITQKARAFAKTLQTRFGLPVYVIDERLTTKAAREFIYENLGGYRELKKAPVDSFAAKIILESWMHAEEIKNTK